MELIKQIKEAENTAKKLIEDTNKNAAFSIENAGKQRTERLINAQQYRRKKIESAQADGTQQGNSESVQLKSKSAQARQQLEQKAIAKMQAAVSTVIEFIKKQS
jgi:V/A-type H+-transporting ATPase subunit G/H